MFPGVDKLKEKLRKSRLENARLKMRLSRAEKKMANKKAPKFILTKQEVGPTIQLRPVMQHLVEAQLKLNCCKKTGMRWSDDMKDFGLSLLYHGPRSYRFLRTLLPLPSVRTLRRYQEKITVKPGVHDHVKTFFAENVEKWPTRKKLCILIIDEMAIMKNFDYDLFNDQVIGYVDDGLTRTHIPANQTVVAALKGLTHSWKQVIGHWFSHDKGKGTFLRDIIFQCIRMCNEVGLILKVLISDQGSKNRNVQRFLKITPDQPYFMNGDEKIYFMYDPPHLIKSLRNNLMKYNLLWRQYIAKWTYIQSLYFQQAKFRVNLIPKITQRHIVFRNSFSKMKVKLATQIFSRSVYIALLVFISLNRLPATAIHTATCIKDFNDFFDCFNSTEFRKDKFTLRYAMSQSSEHVSFLRDKMLNFFNNAAFLNVKRQPDCLLGCRITIQALLGLVEDVSKNYGVRSLRTRNLNQDMLENTYSVLRQQHGSSDHPTSKQTETGLRTLTLSSLSKISSNSNCERDVVEKAIISLQNLPKTLKKNDAPPADLTIDIDLDNPLDEVEENALYYCCGFLTRKFLKHHSSCDHCVNQLLVAPDEQMKTQHYQLFIYLKAHSEQLGYEFGHLHAPTYATFSTLKKMDSIFASVFAVASHENKIGGIIMQKFAENNLILNLCSEDSEKAFIKLFVQKRIQWEVRFINRRLAIDDEERKKQKKLNKLKRAEEKEKKADERKKKAEEKKKKAEERKRKAEERKKNAEEKRKKAKERKRNAEEKRKNAAQKKRMAEEKKRLAQIEKHRKLLVIRQESKKLTKTLSVAPIIAVLKHMR